jgi:hypothetical protein
VTTCEVCGRACPDGDTFCGACGHRLGGADVPMRADVPLRADAVDLYRAQEQPGEPPVVNVRVVNSPFDGCLSCLSWIVVGVLVVFVVGWIASC